MPNDNHDSHEFSKAQLHSMVLDRIDKLGENLSATIAANHNDSKTDVRRLFDRQEQTDRELAAHKANATIHRELPDRPCCYFNDHIADHKMNKKEGLSWLKEAIFFLLGVAAAYILKGGF